jgi:hypothetical protein
VTISATNLLHTDQGLVTQLTTAEKEIPPYARTDQATHTQLLTPAAVSAKTASVHVSNILAKLAVSGRVEAATVVHRLGISPETAG